jgi:anti-sigma regulatory factor (Ser/Thr protein kinase)
MEVRHLSVVLVNQRSEIERLSEAVERFGEEQHLSADDIAGVNLVLDEIVINIIAHGYDDEHEHQIHVSLTLEGDILTIQVEDDGKPFNPLETPPPNLDLPIDDRPIGGLGIYIVRSAVNEIEHRREGGRNILTMKKTMTGREAGETGKGKE